MKFSSFGAASFTLEIRFIDIIGSEKKRFEN
jgi:hypothetical protein